MYRHDFVKVHYYKCMSHAVTLQTIHYNSPHPHYQPTPLLTSLQQTSIDNINLKLHVRNAELRFPRDGRRVPPFSRR